MTTICLIRHGETDWNVRRIMQGIDDIPLNDTGRAQAQKCGKYLQKWHWDAIYSSPLSRARETAQIINAELKIDKIILRQDLIERDFGEASGLSRDECYAIYPDSNFPGAESKQATFDRISKELLEIAKKHDGQRILVVTHGGVIRAISEVMFKHPADRAKSINNVGATTIIYDNGWHLDSFDVSTQ